MTATECTAGEDYYLDVANHKCVSKTECQANAYTFGTGADKACIDAATCTDKGGHVARDGVCADANRSGTDWWVVLLVA